ncbi:MAG: TonB-dependent receptor plug domain-containing protein [Opitutaceae bacterium]
MNSPRSTSPRLHHLLLVPALFALTVASAQQVNPTAATPPDAKTLAKYDKNSNGRLDADELATLQADEARDGKAASPVTTSSSNSGDVVTMSPFTVDATDDKGYAASNSLSGSRLNSRLEDLAGSISVVTKQQLLDTAALDINDIFSYEIGTEGTGQFTDLTNDGRGDYDNVAGNPNTSNRVRGLAAANLTIGGFTASGSVPIDARNLDAVEISRGSNSTLAGVGEAGGTVNLVQSKANVTRETTGATFRADSYGGFGTTLSVNRPIIRNKLAVRAYLAYDEKGYVRKPSVDRTDRQEISFTYRPFKSTTITGSFEAFHQWARRANSISPRDTITPWRERGSPTYDPITGFYTVNGVRSATPVTNVNQLPTGISGIGSSNVRILQYIDGGTFNYLMKGNAPNNSVVVIQNPDGTQKVGVTSNVTQFTQSTNVSTAGPLYKLKGTTDKSIYDWTEINLAAPNYEIQRSITANASLYQNFLNTPRNQLDLELGWRREDVFRYQRSFIAQQDGVGNTLEIDTNERLLDGRINPFFRHTFIGGVNPQIYRRPSFTDNYRWQLAYQLNLTREPNILKWLGLHRVAAYQEYRLNLSSGGGLRYHDTVTNNSKFQPGILTGGNIANNAGALMYPLYYFGNSPSGGVEYANTGPSNPTGDYVASFLGSTDTAWSRNEAVNIQEVYFAIGQQKTKVHTAGASIQSFFFNNQIVTTFGKRKDRQMSRDNIPTVVTGGFIDTANLYNFGPNKRYRQGDTTSKGVVVKPFRGFDFLKQAADQGTGVKRYAAQFFRGLNLHYNRSDSFKPADVAYNVFLSELPNPSGSSEEYGFSLNMFDGKLNMRVTHQESLQMASRSGIGVVATRALGIDFHPGGQNLSFNLYDAAKVWEQTLNPGFSVAQVEAAAATRIGYTPEYIANAGNKSIGDINDAVSKGWELELQFNPTRYWTFKMTGNQQEATDSNVSLYIQQYINGRLPLWTTIINPLTGGLWWNEVNGSQGAPINYFLGNVQNPVNLAITTQGKKKPQTREFRFTGLTNYNLAGIAGDHKWLRNMSVGGSMSWASKGAIGYYGAAPDPDGVVRRLDKEKPFFDKPVTTINLLASYRTKMFSDRVNATFQLNVDNVTESGHLKGIGVNPDGGYWQYRIIDPRQFKFQVRFDL